MGFDIKMKNFEQIQKMVEQIPKFATRAKSSAAKSTGYEIRGMLRKHIEVGGEGWKPLHPISLVKHPSRTSPLQALGRYSRYVYDPDTGTIRVGLGKTNKGKAGAFDLSLQEMQKKHEEGLTKTITPEMRVVLRSLFLKAKLKPLKVTTTTITIPPRPIIGPIFERAKNFAPRHFQEKFFAALDRYMKGTAKK